MDIIETISVEDSKLSVVLVIDNEVESLVDVVDISVVVDINDVSVIVDVDDISVVVDVVDISVVADLTNVVNVVECDPGEEVEVV